VTSDALVGACASLGCAWTWAVASLVFAAALQETKASAAGLGLVKATIAGPLLVVVGLMSGAGWPYVGDQLGALVITSVLGLLVADTAWLMSLARLGVARGVLLIPLVPVTTALLARLTLGEQLGPVALVGGALTLVGVVGATERPGTERGGAISVAGVVVGVAYVLSQAASNVLLKSVLQSAAAMHVASLRLMVGIPMLAVLVVFQGGLADVRPLLTRTRLPTIVVASLIGTMAGMWLGSVGTQRLPVAVATTLAATTPVWALVLLRLRGEAVSLRAVLGAVVAIAGVALLTLWR
jgi:drug/metabolite transporter (DMT)-like permease